MKCIKCARVITYTSATDKGYWACSACGQPTMEEV